MFDPNSLPQPNRPEWATYIEGRSPKFKTHANRGQALNAASYYSRQCQIFRWDFEEDKWIEVWSGAVEKYNGGRKEVCERCGKSTLKEHPYSKRLPHGGWERGVRVTNAGHMGWLAEASNKKKLVEPFKRVWLCWRCR